MAEHSYSLQFNILSYITFPFMLPHTPVNEKNVSIMDPAVIMSQKTFCKESYTESYVLSMCMPMQVMIYKCKMLTKVCSCTVLFTDTSYF